LSSSMEKMSLKMDAMHSLSCFDLSHGASRENLRF